MAGEEGDGECGSNLWGAQELQARVTCVCCYRMFLAVYNRIRLMFLCCSCVNMLYMLTFASTLNLLLLVMP